MLIRGVAMHNHALRRVFGTCLCTIGLSLGLSSAASATDVHFTPPRLGAIRSSNLLAPGAQPLVGSAGPLVYHEGPVNESVDVTLIFWGSNWTETARGRELRERIQNVFAAIHHEMHDPPLVGEESFQGTLAEYWGEHYHVGWVYDPLKEYTPLGDPYTSRLKEIIDSHPGAAPSKVSEASILTELERLHTAEGINETKEIYKGVPKEYFIVLPAPGSTYESNFHDSCGYHAYTKEGAVPWTYGVVPYAGDEPFAALGCEALTLEHLEEPVNATGVSVVEEYADGVSDPIPGEGWTASNGQEIAELCLETLERNHSKKNSTTSGCRSSITTIRAAARKVKTIRR